MLDFEHSAQTFAHLVLELIKRNLILVQTLSILDHKLVTETLTAASDEFRTTFAKELVVLS